MQYFNPLRDSRIVCGVHVQIYNVKWNSCGWPPMSSLKYCLSGTLLKHREYVQK